MPKYPKPFFVTARGVWRVQVDGRQINLGPDEAEARRKYHELMAARARGNEPVEAPPSPEPPVEAGPPSPGHSFVAAVVDEYLAWLKARVAEGSKAPRTLRWYRDYLYSFLRFLRAEEPAPPATPDEAPLLTVDQVLPLHVYRWTDSHPDWKTGKRGAMTAVQRAFSWAGKAGLLKSIGGLSPLRSLEKPPPGRRELLVPEADYREVLDALGSAEARTLVELAWETGMRPAELFTAEAAFLDAGRARLVFPLRHSKGKKVQRVVYLNDRALAIVLAEAGKNPAGPLLRNSDGRPWNKRAVSCFFQRVRRELGRRRVREAGLVPPKVPPLSRKERRDPARVMERKRLVRERAALLRRLAFEHGTKYNLYAFRHTRITEALVNGLDAVTVSVLAGHASTAMVSRVYAHLDQKADHMRRAANQAASNPRHA